VLALGAAILSILAGTVSPALASGSTSITSSGPLTRVEISSDLNCAVDHSGDSLPEFYGDTACATLVAVGGTLFGPASIPAGGSASPRTPYTPVSQLGVLGSGTSGDPYRIVTVVDLGTTGLRLTQTDSYVVGQEAYRTDVAIANSAVGDAAAILYRAGDCYLQDSDFGFGAADAGGAVSCVAGTRIEQWYPLSGGSSYYESDYNSVWVKIGSQTPFTNSCEKCSTFTDNGAGLSWSVSVPAGGSVTRSHLTVFSPLGIVPLTTSKTAGQSSVAQGASDSYTITIDNPNITPATLTSIADTLPAGFTYTTGSTTGVTTSDPSVASQVLTWSGSFAVPASGSISLTFGVTVSTTPDTYTNQASATAADPYVVVGTGPTASVTVTGTGPASAQLTLVKLVDNTGGGTADPTDWTLSASGPTPISGHTGDAAITNAAVGVGTYTLAEAGGPTGYTPGAWSCVGGTLTVSSLVLAADETASCTITNTFVPPPPASAQLTISAPDSVPAGLQFTVQVAITGPNGPCVSSPSVLLEVSDGESFHQAFGPVRAGGGTATFRLSLLDGGSYTLAASVPTPSSGCEDVGYAPDSDHIVVVDIPPGQPIAPCPIDASCAQAPSGSGTAVTLIADSTAQFQPLSPPGTFFGSLDQFPGFGSLDPFPGFGSLDPFPAFVQGCGDGGPTDVNGVLGFFLDDHSAVKTIVFALRRDQLTQSITRYNICWHSDQAFTPLGGGPPVHTGYLPNCRSSAHHRSGADAARPQAPAPCVLTRKNGKNHAAFIVVLAPPGDPVGYPK
jgi:uncharacterized repeat protein (TIGR01451 family)